MNIHLFLRPTFSLLKIFLKIVNPCMEMIGEIFFPHFLTTGKLPEGATKLLALESLNLSDTFLEFLPANFGRLTKLRHLELRENQLATLPKSMARLTALRRLDLGQNELSDVPEVVGSIPSLTELWLDGNKLDVLPDLLGQLPVINSLMFTVYHKLEMRASHLKMFINFSHVQLLLMTISGFFFTAPLNGL